MDFRHSNGGKRPERGWGADCSLHPESVAIIVIVALSFLAPLARLI